MYLRLTSIMMGSSSTLIEKALTDAIVGDVGRYSLSGKAFYAKAISLYDGDTFDAVIYKPCLDSHEVVRHTIRMLGYNAEEIKQPISLPPDVRKQLHAKAVDAKNQLSSLVGLDIPPENRPILVIECKHWDKYGRLLASVYRDEICINEKMQTFCNIVE